MEREEEYVLYFEEWLFGELRSRRIVVDDKKSADSLVKMMLSKPERYTAPTVLKRAVPLP